MTATAPRHREFWTSVAYAGVQACQIQERATVLVHPEGRRASVATWFAERCLSSWTRVACVVALIKQRQGTATAQECHMGRLLEILLGFAARLQTWDATRGASRGRRSTFVACVAATVARVSPRAPSPGMQPGTGHHRGGRRTSWQRSC